MRFTYFQFENFKGISSQKIILNKNINSNSNVFALVGLNESGKTTILEAINYFIHKPETLNALNLANYKVEDIHDLIPINKRDNFNGNIIIEAAVELDEEDIEEIKSAFKAENIYIEQMSKVISYVQKYPFKNSIYQANLYKSEWTSTFKGRIGKKSKKVVELDNSQSQTANIIIKKRMPSILYFPNFLFEFPERIYINPDTEDAKHKFYQVILQDVLDSIGTGANIPEHLIKRINSDDEKDRRNLNSIIGKMQRQLTEVIFSKWSQIFNKEVLKAEVVLFANKDETGPYIEFNIKDDVDTYRIVERSLGFRWFFVYILLTQFRSYRKQPNKILYLFDEPASNLHPSAQTELLKSFSKLPAVIYTTHSHYLINPQWLENTYVVKNEAIDYEDEIKYNSKNTDIKITRYREFAVKYPNQTTYFQPILEVLNYRPSNLELVPQVVITEGKNDFYTYSYIQEIVQNLPNKLKTVPGTSSSNLESLISLYLGWGTNFCVLLDSDKEGLKQKQRYIETFGVTVANLIITYADIDSNWNNIETENLFTEPDRVQIQKKYYPLENTYAKKIFNSSIQELYINNLSVNLSEETLKNFDKVISYLKEKLETYK